MESLQNLLDLFLHPSQLLEAIRNPSDLAVKVGLIGLTAIIFLETGALVFFLPGDSLLVSAGLMAANGQANLNIWYLNLWLIPAAIVGDAVSYMIGAKGGAALFRNPNARFFKPEYLQKAMAFYEKHGGKAIIIARFMPLVRTFVPVVAGAARMPYARFASFNVIGGAAWVSSMTLLGYVLGKNIPGLEKHIEKVIILVVFLSILPGIIEYVRSKSGHRKPEPTKP
ncbi:MAG: DedA family protein [Myxococcaceae bacterium]